MPSPYDHHWRTVEKPAALVKCCYECVRCGMPDRPGGLRTALDGVHLDGNSWNRDPENHTIMCGRCHRAHDYPQWSIDYRAWLAEVRRVREVEHQREIDEADANRELLRAIADEQWAEHTLAIWVMEGGAAA